VPIVEGYGTTEASPVVSINPLHGRRLKSVGGRCLASRCGSLMTARCRRAVRTSSAATGATMLRPLRCSTVTGTRTGDLGYIDDGFLYSKAEEGTSSCWRTGRTSTRRTSRASFAARTHRRRGGCRARTGRRRPCPRGCDRGSRGSCCGGSAGGQRQPRCAATDHGRHYLARRGLSRTHTLKVRKNLVIDYLRGQQASPPPPAAISTDALHHIIAACSKFAGAISEDMSLVRTSA